MEVKLAEIQPTPDQQTILQFKYQELAAAEQLLKTKQAEFRNAMYESMLDLGLSRKQYQLGQNNGQFVYMPIQPNIPVEVKQLPEGALPPPANKEVNNEAQNKEVKPENNVIPINQNVQNETTSENVEETKAASAVSTL